MHELIAHVRKLDDGTWDQPQSLLDHLLGVADLAGAFASKFNAQSWGRALGLLHDFGKGSAQWAAYLARKSGYDDNAHLEHLPGKLPHAIYGAIYSDHFFPAYIGRTLAYCIAGHHAGLPDWSSTEGQNNASLISQKQLAKPFNSELSLDYYLQNLHLAFPEGGFDRGLALSLWIRMLFSCLIDADRLDTELYMDPIKAKKRGHYDSIEELYAKNSSHNRKIDEKSQTTQLNLIRREIRSKCIDAANRDQGVFSLSVPTGGGKTLSGLTFALTHAKKHKLDRIIYVMPYLSIIEQNASVFREVLGENQVIEHHSNLTEDQLSKQGSLATENWDAPVIVTTAVQFFESLFASSPSKCRKLHRLLNSVIILDEAHIVPVEFLKPILESLQLLVKRYGVTLLLSTATQPSFVERKNFSGFTNIHEIIGTHMEVCKLYRDLKRTEIIFTGDEAIQSWEEIAELLMQEEQVLCIVSDRKSCRELYKLMPTGTFHLSALMCAEHRSVKIKEIKDKLIVHESVRVISTSLIESGVDVDFPVVYRSFAGVDSIIQAAGRCNREGLNDELGKVFVFTPPKLPPEGSFLRKAYLTSRAVLGNTNIDPSFPEVIETYFSELYGNAISLDKHDICGLLNPEKHDRKELSMFFRTASSRFKMIDDSLQKTIIVPYGLGKDLINQILENGPSRDLLRKLQRFTVGIYENDYYSLLMRGALKEVFDNNYALTSLADYSESLGLLVNLEEHDAADYVIRERK